MPYEKQEYPKWVDGIVCQNEAEHQALKDGTAIIQELRSAQGSERTIVGIKKKPKVQKEKE